MTGPATSPRRVAVVTGAARGIGAAIACRLAEDGCDVALIDLDRDATAEAAGKMTGTGCRAIAIAADVADEASVNAAMAEVHDRLGPSGILVNNAGIFLARPLAETGTDAWQRVIDVNLRSAFLMARAVEPSMRALGWGRIINLSSVAALGTRDQAGYAASKAGLIGLTRALAIELGPLGITVNAIAPGFIVTDMTRAIAIERVADPEELLASLLPTISVGRAGSPDDIANAAAFFADPRSSFVTGQTLYVAGAPRG